MRLKWQEPNWSEPEFKLKWDTEREKDAPADYYAPRRSRYADYATNSDSTLVPRYRKPKYELGSDEEAQLRMTWG